MIPNEKRGGHDIKRPRSDRASAHCDKQRTRSAVTQISASKTARVTDTPTAQRDYGLLVSSLTRAAGRDQNGECEASNSSMVASSC
jgi:hypothetical protein